MAFNKVDSLEELQKEWRNPYIQWYAAGMPSFISQNGEPYKQLVLKFRSKEDRRTWCTSTTRTSRTCLET